MSTTQMQSLHHYDFVVYSLTSLSYGYHAVSAWSIYSFIELLHIQENIRCMKSIRSRKHQIKRASDQENKVPML